MVWIRKELNLRGAGGAAAPFALYHEDGFRCRIVKLYIYFDDIHRRNIGKG